MGSGPLRRRVVSDKAQEADEQISRVIGGLMSMSPQVGGWNIQTP